MAETQDDNEAPQHQPEAGERGGEREGERGGERIAKLLARAGVASRREVERMIADKRVALNGTPLETPATVLTGLRGITVDGQPVAKPERTRLFRFHKPTGLITAERDPAGRPTIYDALRNALPAGTPRMMPVGRLDFSTEGLLLLTNDGEFKRQLELPATGVPRTYRARTFGEISQAQLEELIEGMTVEGVNYGRIDANLERRTGRNQWIELTLTEGKNREVRRVLEHLGLKVSRLIRTAYGPFALGDLRSGGAEEVRREDLERFRSSVRSGPAEKGATGASHTAPQPREGEARPGAGAPRLSRPPRSADAPSRLGAPHVSRPARATEAAARTDASRSSGRRGRAEAEPRPERRATPAPPRRANTEQRPEKRGEPPARGRASAEKRPERRTDRAAPQRANAEPRPDKRGEAAAPRRAKPHPVPGAAPRSGPRTGSRPPAPTDKARRPARGKADPAPGPRSTRGDAPRREPRGPSGSPSPHKPNRGPRKSPGKGPGAGPRRGPAK